MRSLLAIALCSSVLGGCGGGDKLTVNGRTLSVADQMFTTRPMSRFTDCPGLSTSQVKIQLTDFAPACPLDKNYQTPDPTIEHEELDLVLSLDGVPDYKLKGFDINPNTSCQIGGGPVYAVFLHFPVNATAPDTTTVATGGHITVTKYDGAKSPFQGKFTINFGGSTVNGSLNALNCDM
jgi:hypothetical protein